MKTCRPWLVAAIFLTIWLLCMVGGRSRLFRDQGTLWHPVVGQQILTTGKLPVVDTYSFTRPGAYWIAQWWLADCGLALISRLAGLDGLLLATSLVLACTYTWIANRLLNAGLHPLLAILITVLAFAGGSYHFHPRPHLATIVLVGWTFARLSDFEIDRISLKGLYPLVPVFMIWTNLHGGVVGGIGELGFAILGWLLLGRLGMRGMSLSGSQVWKLLVVLLVSAATIFVNPYGIELPRVWFSLMSSPLLSQLFDEHRPLFASSTGLILLPLIGLYLMTILGIPRQEIRATWIIPLIWFALALTRIRYGPLFAITAAIALGEMLPHARWVGWLTRQGSEVFRIQPREQLSQQGLLTHPSIRALELLMLLTLGLQIANVRFPMIGRGWARLDPTHWPIKALPDLKAYERTHPPGTPIFNEMLFGGFLISQTPGLRVFIDDRYELYGEPLIRDLANASEQNPAQLDQWADQYQFDAALTQSGTRLDRYLADSKGWKPVSQSSVANFYQRVANSNPSRDVIRKSP